ncbi:MAG: response regulator [Myxococcaceae bacterium]|nr:response regulator [Myxococcaceae bacterium]
MKRPLRVLIVEDSADDADLLLLELRRGDYQVTHRRVDTAQAMRQALKEQTWDLVLSDFSMPTFSAPEALALLKDVKADIPFLIVSGTIGEDIAVDALRAGAHDFMVKGRLARLVPAIERELRDAANRRSKREAELAQRATEARFRGIMETATDAVISTDASGNIDYVNACAEKMFGYSSAELLHQPLSVLLAKQERSGQHDGLLNDLASGDSPALGKTLDLAGRRKNGTEFPIDLSFGRWLSNGQTHFAAIIRDVSDRKKVEAQLLVADRMVAVGTLAAGVAHEINNPLAAVMANLELAATDVEELAAKLDDKTITDRLTEELRDAREGADRVRHIVRDLKIFSRGEDEKHGPVDVERVMESTLRMAANELRHRAQVVKEYQPVPLVEGSEARLGQVFLNLVVNAAQAIEEGQEKQNEIRVSTRYDGKRVIVTVADTGEGIAPDILSRLFTPFLTTKPVGVGTGLGLSICHRIVTSFGGDIVAESEVGKGTRFMISLVPTATQPEPIRAVNTPVMASLLRRGRVLVVDDETMVAKAVQRAIGTDHDVVTLHRAKLALERISAGERYDLILCDLMMPEMTGMDLHREISLLAPAQAASMVFLTGGAFTPRARDFLDSVSNHRLEKPFDILGLRALVNHRIRRLG